MFHALVLLALVAVTVLVGVVMIVLIIVTKKINTVLFGIVVFYWAELYL
jgi:hypothetical protein